MQLRATVFGTQARTPGKGLPRFGGQLHVGSGHVLPVQQVVTELVGIFPIGIVVHVKVVVDVVLTVGKLHASVPETVLPYDAPVGLRGGEQRTAARH